MGTVKVKYHFSKKNEFNELWIRWSSETKRNDIRITGENPLSAPGGKILVDTYTEHIPSECADFMKANGLVFESLEK